MTDSKDDSISIRLHPLNKELRVQPGASLHDVLFPLGVEYPCGGRGNCKGCRIRVLQGDLPPTEVEARAFAPAELADGWRLACQARATTDLVLHIAQWDSPILSDDRTFHFEPQEGFGVAIDLGTTTLVAQLLDLESGQVLAVRTALNPQARHGGDIMSRVEYAIRDGGQQRLEMLIRREIGRMVGDLISAAQVDGGRLKRGAVVGNTVMHHLFSGCTVEPLSRYPFHSQHLELQRLTAAELGWRDLGALVVEFLPCLGGFVGSDILAGVLATRLHEAEQLEALVDLGTNGEIVIGNRDGLLCAATAAGPAFEGARIWMGMRAATGAINSVRVEDGKLVCGVIGDVPARGICGSGLVDAVAAALDEGLVLSSGRMRDGAPHILLADPVKLSQTDVRQLQLAKGAVAAGIHILAKGRDVPVSAITRLHLAGAFGNYIRIGSARRIGLLPIAPERIVPAGNTALHGAKLALFSADACTPCRRILAMTRHMGLSADPKFQETYVEEMPFPQTMEG